MPEPKQLPSGKWRIRLYLGKDKNGKKVYVSFTADKKSEVKYKAKEFYLHTKTSEQPLTMTLGEAIDMYISSKSNILSPSTIRGYKVIRKRCFQNLMGVSLRNITQDKIQRAVNIEALSYSPKYIKNAHGLISAVLATYYPELILRTTLPKKRKKEGYIPDDEDISLLLSETKGTDIYLPILLSATLSLRRSEICGLKWSDINFITNKVTVQRALVLNSDNEWVLKDPKTFSSFRVLTMPSVLINELKRQYSDSSPFVCALNPGQVSNQFIRALKKANLPKFRFHDLRHYNASVMLALNLPDKYAMERGGWSNISTMKNIYMHTYAEKQNNYDKRLMAHFDLLEKRMTQG